MKKNKLIFLIPLASFLTVLIGTYLGEDSIGGGKIDYTYHLTLLNKFSENFFNTYNEFGMLQESSSGRNSPIFLYTAIILFKSWTATSKFKNYQLYNFSTNCDIFYKMS